MSDQDTPAPPEAGAEATEASEQRTGGKAGLAALLVVVAVGLVGWRVMQARSHNVAPSAEATAPGPMADGPGPGGGWAPPTPEERAQRFEQMATEVGLDEQQKAALQTLYDDYGEQMQALRENQELAQEVRRAELRKLREERTEKAKALMTAEQQTKYEEVLSRRRGGPGGGGPGGPGGEAPGAGGPPAGEAPTAPGQN